jgi:hypothetical protein
MDRPRRHGTPALDPCMRRFSSGAMFSLPRMSALCRPTPLRLTSHQRRHRDRPKNWPVLAEDTLMEADDVITRLTALP